MRRSEDRILTTHTGSLPRSEDLLAELVRRDRGEAVDTDALDARIRAEVAALVRRQADAGVAVVNDGEAGKIGYATYVTERLEGFGGEADPPGPPTDMLDFPDLLAREQGRRIAATRRCPRATGRSPTAASTRSEPTSRT
jgi:5-methyltetrahydropteroyltriglutamate--homocysteine methyltransferase